MASALKLIVVDVPVKADLSHPEPCVFIIFDGADEGLVHRRGLRLTECLCTTAKTKENKLVFSVIKMQISNCLYV